jgi:hypothetical protein
LKRPTFFFCRRKIQQQHGELHVFFIFMLEIGQLGLLACDFFTGVLAYKDIL